MKSRICERSRRIPACLVLGKLRRVLDSASLRSALTIIRELPEKLGIIAGNGAYPRLLTDAARKAGVQKIVAAAFT
jgi:DUF1009 family protein